MKVVRNRVGILVEKCPVCGDSIYADDCGVDRLFGLIYKPFYWQYYIFHCTSIETDCIYKRVKQLQICGIPHYYGTYYYNCAIKKFNRWAKKIDKQLHDNENFIS